MIVVAALVALVVGVVAGWWLAHRRGRRHGASGRGGGGRRRGTALDRCRRPAHVGRGRRRCVRSGPLPQPRGQGDGRDAHRPARRRGDRRSAGQGAQRRGVAADAGAVRSAAPRRRRHGRTAPGRWRGGDDRGRQRASTCRRRADGLRRQHQPRAEDADRGDGRARRGARRGGRPRRRAPRRRSHARRGAPRLEDDRRPPRAVADRARRATDVRARRRRHRRRRSGEPGPPPRRGEGHRHRGARASRRQYASGATAASCSRRSATSSRTPSSTASPVRACRSACAWRARGSS